MKALWCIAVTNDSVDFLLCFVILYQQQERSRGLVHCMRMECCSEMTLSRLEPSTQLCGMLVDLMPFHLYRNYTVTNLECVLKHCNL